MTEMTLPRDETLHLFDLPEFLSEDRYYFIHNRIWKAEQEYYIQCRTGYSRYDPFYREDGSISKWTVK